MGTQTNFKKMWLLNRDICIQIFPQIRSLALLPCLLPSTAWVPYLFPGWNVAEFKTPVPEELFTKVNVVLSPWNKQEQPAFNIGLTIRNEKNLSFLPVLWSAMKKTFAIYYSVWYLLWLQRHTIFLSIVLFYLLIFPQCVCIVFPKDVNVSGKSFPYECSHCLYSIHGAILPSVCQVGI